jgi:dethiobiotin synthetase
MRGIFVAGTDTGVGKTVVAAGIAWLLKSRNVDVGVMKPFATASKPHSAKYRSEDTAMLAAAVNAGEPDEELNPFFFKVPASPLMAAQLSGKPPVVMQEVLFALKKLGIMHNYLVVEGIGGLMVPLTEREFVADFVRLSGLPVVIVSRPQLGTINHTLLTVRVCREFGLDVRGIIVNGMPKKPNVVEKNTPKMLETLAGVPMLAVLPKVKSPSHKKIGALLAKTPAAEKLLAVKHL